MCGAKTERIREALDKVRSAYQERFRFAGDGYYLWGKYPELENVQRNIAKWNPVLLCSPRILDAMGPAKGDKLLDLGCGKSLLDGHFDKWPCDYYGVDVCVEALWGQHLHGRLEGPVLRGLMQGDAFNLPFKAETFDLVTCVGVIEYYHPDVALCLLREISRVCQPGGRFYGNIPNSHHPLAHEMFMIEVARGCPDYPWETREFGSLLAMCGFEVREVCDTFLMVHYVAERCRNS